VLWTGSLRRVSRHDHRIEALRKVEARCWVSFEPLIEPVGEASLEHIDWAVVGGENAAEEDRHE